MSRPPRPGQTKTRLIPWLGPEGAARLQAAFTADILERCSRSSTWQLMVYWSAAFDAGDLPGAAHRQQRGEDLGARMLQVLRDAQAEGVERSVIIGSDSPDLPAQRIESAFAALERAPAVLAPAFDGGYVLIGARVPQPRLFEAVPWGTAEVLEVTAERAREAGLELALVEPWYDVDRPDELRFLRAHLELLARTGEERAPRTRALLRELLA